MPGRRVSIIVPDGKINVNGVAYYVDLSGIDDVVPQPSKEEIDRGDVRREIHAVCLNADGTAFIEYRKPRMNIDISEEEFNNLFSEYVDKWDVEDAKAPPEPEAEPPQTEDEQINEAVLSNPVTRGLVRAVAGRLGLTESELVDDMKRLK